MISALVDTNFLLRFLTKDILKQAVKVRYRFEEARVGKIKLIILHITIIEVLFQLENWYKFPKTEAIEKLILLLSPDWLEVERKEAVFDALTAYRNISVDFVDLLTWSMAKNLTVQILSFDKDFDKLSPKLRLEP